MRGQIVAREISCDVRVRPVDQRIDLHPPIRSLLDRLQVLTVPAVQALAARDPGVEAFKRRVEWLHFALPAALIRVRLPQRAFRIDPGYARGLRSRYAQLSQTEAHRQSLAIRERLGEQLSGI